MYKTYYTKVIDEVGIERIGDVEYGDHYPEREGDWLEAPNDWGGNKGEMLAWFDDAMRRIPDATLAEQGKRIDNIGLWYNKETRETKMIRDYGIPIGDEYTRSPPLQNELFQKWDEDADCFIVDTEKKDRAEKESELADLMTQVSELERKALRPLREKELGIEVEKSAKKILGFQGKIERLRPEIKRLENELGIEHEEEPDEEMESA
jgi:hypothetical protein